MTTSILPDAHESYVFYENEIYENKAYENKAYENDVHNNESYNRDASDHAFFCEHAYQYGYICPCEYSYQQQEDLGRLDVQSNKLFVAGRYAGFMTWGYFYHYAISYPVVFAESSVIDAYTGAALALGDIINIDMKEKVLDLLGEAILAYAPQAAPYLYLIDETWLGHVVLCDNGLIVLLSSEIVAWEFGFMSVEISYDDLDDAFMLRAELGLWESPRRAVGALIFNDGPSAYTDMILGW